MTKIQNAKKPGDLVYVLGKTLEELGGSEYYASKGIIRKSSPGGSCGEGPISIQKIIQCHTGQLQKYQ